MRVEKDRVEKECEKRRSGSRESRERGGVEKAVRVEMECY